jgi:hypothetical protein
MQVDTMMALVGPWAQFYVETIEYDRTQEWPLTSIREETQVSAISFAQAMSRITKEEPNGTEDRTWCRTYAALENNPLYATYLTEKSLDRWAIDHCKNMLMSVSI